MSKEIDTKQMSLLGDSHVNHFSIAGKRKGTDDDRYLWDETIRVVRECKPKWFIGENVEGLVNIQDGMVLLTGANDLEKEGFQVQCLIIPASGIGAWHKRSRIWIMAANTNAWDSLQGVQESEKAVIRQMTTCKINSIKPSNLRDHNYTQTTSNVRGCIQLQRKIRHQREPRNTNKGEHLYH
jgi:site-specific DNA-cytosine methylase